MLTGKQFVVAINEGGVGGQNYGNNCRKQNVLATASVGLQHQQKAQGRGGGGRGLWLKRHIQWQQQPLREIANKPQSTTATATNDEADKKCVDSSFSTMGIVLGIRVKEGWKDRGGRGSLSWFVRHGYRLFLSILKSS